MNESKPGTGDEGAEFAGEPKRAQPLRSLFFPKTVAVIGATEAPDSPGRSVFWNLLSHPFGGTVFPVNPHRGSVLGVRAYPDVESLPDRPELAVIATPAPTVPGIVRQCIRAGVKGAIIISAGFKETGAAGAALELQILEEARHGQMRIIGPNCLGVISPISGLNATFANAMARPGNVAFISQSGALCTAILDWSLRENVGFSAFVSVGSMLDVGWGDLIDYLGDDPRTRSILIYMETIGDARSFLSAAREVALSKPIIVIKVGRTEAASKAARSHTGSLTGSDEVLDAAFRRSGVIRVDSIAELFYMAELLAKQPLPLGRRLTIVTNAGGPGVLAADAALGEGSELTQLSSETLRELDRVLPPHWSRGNPIDILGDAGPERYAKAIEIAAGDGDGLLAILTPQASTDPTRTAEAMRRFASLKNKPVLACWMGGADVAAGEAILNRARIPTFSYPDTAARLFTCMWRYSSNLRSLYETPMPSAGQGQDSASCREAASLIERIRGSGRTLLTEAESKQLLQHYGIPAVTTLAAASEDEAVRLASEIGFPIAIKLHSLTVTHKSDVGGVHLDVADAEGVRRAYRSIEASVRERAGDGHFLGVTVQPMIRQRGFELILGSSIDPQLGPVLLFGAGGELVEVSKDKAVGLPPLNTTLARRIMEQTRIFGALHGVRGRKPVDLAALEQVFVRFSQLVVEQSWIREIEINPLLASGDSLLALDARVTLHGPEVAESQRPRPAIRPYPAQYAGTWTMKDGTAVTIRPIRPDDEPMMVRFHQDLSEQSVYSRYFHMVNVTQRVAHEGLARVCFIDYDRSMALVAEHRSPATEEREIIGLGRLTRSGPGQAEFDILISDRFQGGGLGTELLTRLVEIGRTENLQRITADILPENLQMQLASRRAGFQLRHEPESNLVVAELELAGASAGG